MAEIHHLVGDRDTLDTVVRHPQVGDMLIGTAEAHIRAEAGLHPVSTTRSSFRSTTPQTLVSAGTKLFVVVVFQGYEL